jgi:hypothetical protein
MFWRHQRFARRAREKRQEGSLSSQVEGVAIAPLPCRDHSVM